MVVSIDLAPTPVQGLGTRRFAVRRLCAGITGLGDLTVIEEIDGPPRFRIPATKNLRLNYLV